MITQVSSLNVRGAAVRDPRRKAQSVQFRNNSKIPYTMDYNEQISKHQNSALWSSIAIVAGSILFTMGFFMLSALKNMKH